jgi:hypothetical protein
MLEQLDLGGGGVHHDHRGVVVDLPDGAAGHILVRDYETRGLLRLNLFGAHRYAADPGTDVVCCAYAVDDDPVQLWTPGDPIPSVARNPPCSSPIRCHGLLQFPDRQQAQLKRQL